MLPDRRLLLGMGLMRWMRLVGMVRLVRLVSRLVSRLVLLLRQRRLRAVSRIVHLETLELTSHHFVLRHQCIAPRLKHVDVVLLSAMLVDCCTRVN